MKPNKFILNLIPLIATPYIFLYICASHAENSQQRPINLDTGKILSWHRFKDELGTTFSGSTSWHQYMQFIETQLQSMGAVDMTRQGWNYPLWQIKSAHPQASKQPHTSAKRGLQLVIDKQVIDIAHYGANSGSTPKQGVEAELVLYSKEKPHQFYKNKILLYRIPQLTQAILTQQADRPMFSHSDYEFRSAHHSLPAPFTLVPASHSVSFDTWWQLYSAYQFKENVLKKTQASACIILFNMNRERLNGLHSFPVTTAYNIPTLYIDESSSETLLTHAQQQSHAKLTLLSTTSNVSSYQLIAYLPGRFYKTPQDKKILLTSHTDGPSVSQENGALGLLALLEHFASIAQSDRNKTLMLYLDNRHYMPGKEAANHHYDWFYHHPFKQQNIHGLIALEHLGQLEFRIDQQRLVPSGRVEPSYLWTRNDSGLIRAATQAVNKFQWPRVIIKSVERPGVNASSQGIWYGMGKRALEWDIPAFAMMGTQGAYWNSHSGIDRFDVDLFSRQVKTMIELTHYLMQN